MNHLVPMRLVGFEKDPNDGLDETVLKVYRNSLGEKLLTIWKEEKLLMKRCGYKVIDI